MKQQFLTFSFFLKKEIVKIDGAGGGGEWLL